MILGHLTATYALREPLKQQFPVFLPLLPLLFGALLPDIIDKPLAMLFGLPGRGLAHSLVIMAPLSLLLIRLFSSKRKIMMTVFAGALLHIAEDFASPVFIFWPLLGSWPEVEHLGLWMKIYSYYILLSQPLTVAVEFLSYPFCLYFLLRRKPPVKLNLGKTAVMED